MAEHSNDWHTLGLYWHDGAPALALADQSGCEAQHPVPPASQVGYQLVGTRRCVGVWHAQRQHRQPCPFAAPLAQEATAAQCGPCARADPGKQLARDALVDDGRTYRLYLAWFGPGMLKIGLTAAARGSNRLAEQGALAFTWLAEGRLPAVRAAEQRISSSGLVPERRRRKSKLAGWKRVQPAQRDQEITALYRQITETISWGVELRQRECRVVDHTRLFGLDHLPGTWRHVTGLHAGSVIAGAVRCAIGRDLLLDTQPYGPLVLDTRLLAGWPVDTTTLECRGLELRSRLVGGDDDHCQPPLF